MTHIDNISSINQNMIVGGLTNAAVSYTTKLAIVGTGAISLPIIIKAALIGAAFAGLQRLFIDEIREKSPSTAMLILMGGVLLPLITCTCMQNIAFVLDVPVELPVIGTIHIYQVIAPFVEADNMHYIAALGITFMNSIFSTVSQKTVDLVQVAAFNKQTCAG